MEKARSLVSINLRIYFLTFVISNLALAEGEPWRNVDSMAFANGTLGLSITEGDYIQDSRGPYFYDLDINTWSMKPIDEAQFKTKFNPKHAYFDHKKFEGAPSEIRTSGGEILKVKYTGCEEQDEGGPACSGQKITFGEKHFSLDHGNVSILSAERFSDQLWLALGYLGEYGWYGKGVYVYDLKLNKKLFFYEEEVMGGLLVSTIIRNSDTGDIWLGTNLGLRIIDPTFKKIRSYYFYEAFDAITGVPQLEISSKPHEDDWLAKIARRLDVKDVKLFRSAVKKLNPTSISVLEDLRRFSETFYPVELNVLSPFFLDAINSKDEGIKSYADIKLCKFRDIRVSEYYTNKKLNSLIELPFGNPYLDECIDKLLQAGLAPKDPSIVHQIDLLKEFEQALVKIYRRESSQDLNAYYVKALNSADSLAELGNQTGVKLIIDNMKNTKKSSGFSLGFFVQTLLKTKNNNNFDQTLADILDGSTAEFDLDNAFHICSYFNPSYHQFRGSKPLSEKYARAILKVLPRLQDKAAKQPTPNLKFSITTCVDALKSQLKNEEVLKKFNSQVYTKLSSEEKQLYDQISTDENIPHFLKRNY